jgi:hypothetical protein
MKSAHDIIIARIGSDLRNASMAILSQILSVAYGVGSSQARWAGIRRRTIWPQRLLPRAIWRLSPKIMPSRLYDDLCGGFWLFGYDMGETNGHNKAGIIWGKVQISLTY